MQGRRCEMPKDRAQREGGLHGNERPRPHNEIFISKKY